MALRDETRVIREIAGDGPPADSGTGRLFIDAPDTHSAAELVDQLATARPSLMREGTHCRVCVDLDLGDERQLVDVLAGIERWLQRTGRSGAVVAVHDRTYLVEPPAAAA